MTQDEIIEMANEAHRKLVTEVYVGHTGQLDPWTIELLKIFANLVADKYVEAAFTAAEKAVDLAIKLEREACAKVCDEVGEHPSLTPQHCAESIRARGEA